MVVEASRDVETPARESQRRRRRRRRGRGRGRTDRDLDAQAGVAFPGLPFDVAVSLVEKHLPDPADLAVLRAVSKGMRDAVDATGRKVQEFKEDDAVERGYVSTLKCLRRRGRLSDERLLCAAAARVGDLEELKALRAANVPWNNATCSYAAKGGHFDVLLWARENGCPWDNTCASAAEGGHLEILKWARENGCAVGLEDVREGGGGRPPRCAPVGAREWMPVARVDLRARGGGRSPRYAEVVARERLSVELSDVRVRGEGRPPRRAEVGARERVHVEC
jgi:hypothetical protein